MPKKELETQPGCSGGMTHMNGETHKGLAEKHSSTGFGGNNLIQAQTLGEFTTHMKNKTNTKLLKEVIENMYFHN